jgi:hypothetical protein
MTNPINFASALAEKMNVPTKVLPTVEQLQQVSQLAQNAQMAGQPQQPKIA